MAYFKLSLLTPKFGEKKYSSQVFSEFYSQEDLFNYNKEVLKEKKFITKNTFCYSYDESISLHFNGQKDLSFKMLQKSFDNFHNYNENIFTTIFHIGTIICLEDRFNNHMFFTIKDINLNLLENNIEYSYTCQDSFTYQLIRQHSGYEIKNDSSSTDFIGSKNLDWWLQKITKECNIHYEYVPTSEYLYLCKENESYLVKKSNEIGSNKQNIVKILKDGINIVGTEEYKIATQTFPFSISGSNADAAIIAAAQMIGYNIETSEHLNDDGTYTLYYWAEPSKKDKVTGIKYSPFNNIQEFGTSLKGDSLTTVMYVDENTVGDNIVGIIPNLSPFFSKYISSNEWENSKYIKGRYKELLKGETYSTSTTYKNIKFDNNNRRLIFNNDSKEENVYFGQFKNRYKMEGNIGGIDLSECSIGIEDYIPEEDNNIDLTEPSKTVNSENSIEKEPPKEDESLTAILPQNTNINSQYFNKRYKYYLFNSENSIITKKDDLFNCKITFYTETNQEDRDFAEIADECPWLENCLIDFSYYWKQNIITRQEYKDLLDKFQNDLRIINGKVLYCSTEYYNQLNEKVKTLSNLENQLDTLGAIFTSDYLEEYRRNGTVNLSDNFASTYENVFTAITPNQSLMGRNAALTDYFNKYFDSQQRFFKNIKNFRQYWNEKNIYARNNNPIIYTYNIEIVDKEDDKIKKRFTTKEIHKIPENVKYSDICEAGGFYIKDKDNNFQKQDVVTLGNFNNYLQIYQEQPIEIKNKNTKYNNKNDYYVKLTPPAENLGNYTWSLLQSSGEVSTPDYIFYGQEGNEYYKQLSKDELLAILVENEIKRKENNKKLYYNISNYQVPLNWSRKIPSLILGKETNIFVNLNKITWYNDVLSNGKNGWDILYSGYVKNFPGQDIVWKIYNIKDNEWNIVLQNKTNLTYFGDINLSWGWQDDAPLTWKFYYGLFLSGIDNSAHNGGKIRQYNHIVTGEEEPPLLDKEYDFAKRDLGLNSLAKHIFLYSWLEEENLNSEKQWTIDESLYPIYTTGSSNWKLIINNMILTYCNYIYKTGEQKDLKWDKNSCEIAQICGLQNYKDDYISLISNNEYWKLANNNIDLTKCKLILWKDILSNENFYYPKFLKTIDNINTDEEKCQNATRLNKRTFYFLSNFIKDYSEEEIKGYTLISDLSKLNSNNIKNSYSLLYTESGENFDIIDTEDPNFKDYENFKISFNTIKNDIKNIYNPDTLEPVKITDFNLPTNIFIINKENASLLTAEEFKKALNQSSTESKIKQYEEVINNRIWFNKQGTRIPTYSTWNATNKYFLTDKIKTIEVYNSNKEYTVQSYVERTPNLFDTSYRYIPEDKTIIKSLTLKQNNETAKFSEEKSTDVSNLTNGQFWINYHTDQTKPILFNTAAQIEAQLSEYWSVAYSAAYQCEYCIPEYWQQNGEGYKNYFYDNLFDENGNIIDTFIPQIEQYQENGITEFQKYYYHFDNEENHMSIENTSNYPRSILNTALAECGITDISNLTAEEYGNTSYYYLVKGGTKWSDFARGLNNNVPIYNNYGGHYLMLVRLLYNNFIEAPESQYFTWKKVQEQFWRDLYTQYPNIILCSHYSNSDATTSKELLQMAKMAFKDLSAPEKQYNITLIENAKYLTGYEGQELKIGEPILVNADEYYHSIDEIYQLINQYLFITDIKYDLRKDDNIQLTVNSIKYQDKLIQSLVKLIR